MVNRPSQLVRDKIRRHEIFLRLHKTYMRNLNHKGTERNRIDFHRDEIVYHYYRTLNTYWRHLIERLDQMFEYQTFLVIFIPCLNVSGRLTFRTLGVLTGYELDHCCARCPPRIDNYVRILIVDTIWVTLLGKWQRKVPIKP